MSFDNTLSNKQFPVSGIATLQQISNQIIRTIEISSPDLDIGANKTITSLLESGKLEKMTKLKVRVYDGKTTKEMDAIFMNRSHSAEINRFSATSLFFRYNFKYSG